MKTSLRADFVMLLEDYGIEVTPELEQKLLESENNPVVMPDFQKIAKEATQTEPTES